jgi:hypothetical protein
MNPAIRQNSTEPVSALSVVQIEEGGCHVVAIPGHLPRASGSRTTESASECLRMPRCLGHQGRNIFLMRFVPHARKTQQS